MNVALVAQQAAHSTSGVVVIDTLSRSSKVAFAYSALTVLLDPHAIDIGDAQPVAGLELPLPTLARLVVPNPAFPRHSVCARLAVAVPPQLSAGLAMEVTKRLNRLA